MDSKIKNNTRRFHIIIDAWGCDPALISDKVTVETAIGKVADLCGMTIVHGPVVIEGVPENPGLTGFAVIDFSHISIHTFTNEQEVCVDIFSCKQFDYEAVKTYVKEVFRLQDGNTKYVEVKYQTPFSVIAKES